MVSRSRNEKVEGLLFDTEASSQSALQYVEVHNAGAANGAAIRLLRPVPVTDTTITRSLGAGIEYDESFSNPNYDAPTNRFVDVDGEDAHAR